MCCLLFGKSTDWKFIYTYVFVFFFPFFSLFVDRAIFVGSPPAYRGGTAPSNDLELKLLQLFPESHYFIEKPVAAGPVDQAHEVTAALVKSGQYVSVG